MIGDIDCAVSSGNVFADLGVANTMGPTSRLNWLFRSTA